MTRVSRITCVSWHVCHNVVWLTVIYSLQFEIVLFNERIYCRNKLNKRFQCSNKLIMQIFKSCFEVRLHKYSFYYHVFHKCDAYWWYTQRNLFEIVLNQSRNQILFTIFQLIWNQTDVRLDPSQSKNGKYNLILGWFNKISKIFLSVCVDHQAKQ